MARIWNSPETSGGSIHRNAGRAQAGGRDGAPANELAVRKGAQNVSLHISTHGAHMRKWGAEGERLMPTPSKPPKRPQYLPGTSALLFPRAAGLPEDFSPHWPDGAGASDQTGSPGVAAGPLQAGSFGAGRPSPFGGPDPLAFAPADAGVQPARALRRDDNLPFGGQLQSDFRQSDGSGFSGQPGFETAAYRGRRPALPSPPSPPRPAVPEDPSLGRSYMRGGLGGAVEEGGAGGLLQNAEEFLGLMAEIRYAGLGAHARRLMDSGFRPDAHPQQHMFADTSGNGITVNGYSFNDPQRTTFYVLPIWTDRGPNYFTLVSVQRGREVWYSTDLKRWTPKPPLIPPRGVPLRNILP